MGENWLLDLTTELTALCDKSAVGFVRFYLLSSYSKKIWAWSSNPGDWKTFPECSHKNKLPVFKKKFFLMKYNLHTIQFTHL